MRGAAALLPAKNKLKQIYPAKGTWGNVHSLMPFIFLFFNDIFTQQYWHKLSR